MDTFSDTVAIYCRISNDPTRLNVGVERQREDCVALAEGLWPGRTTRAFVDNDLSAADPDVERPQWKAMLDALRAGEVNEVVAYDQSRLTRQPLEWEQLLIVLARRGITAIHTVREGDRDVGDGGGRMVSRIMAAVDAEYVETLKARIKRAMRQIAIEGRPNGGKLFGYATATGQDGRKTRQIVTIEANAIKWAAGRVLIGDTLSSIARELERRRVPHARTGKLWYPTTVRKMLTRPAIAGLRPDPDGKLIPAIWPPILDRRTWLRVSAALSQPTTLVRSNGVPMRISRHRSPARRHLLTAGLAVCGVCGAPLGALLRPRRNGTNTRSYRCSGWLGGGCVSIDANLLEGFVVESVLVALRTKRADVLSGTYRSEVEVLTETLAGVDADLADLAAAWGRGEVSRSEWEAARVGLARRSQSLRDRLALTAVPAFRDVDRLAKSWPTMGLPGRRAVILAVLERVEVDRLQTRRTATDRIRLIWRPAPSADDLQPEPTAPREADQPLAWLSSVQAASYLAVGRTDLQRRIAEGTVRVHRVGGTDRFARSELDGVIERARIEPRQRTSR